MSGRLLGGRYELGAALGRGGMARVVRARDQVLQRPVAIKLLEGDRADPSLRERFLREARAAASFSHPNAVAVYDTGEDRGDAYIVMELVEGRTLAEHLSAGGALEPERAVAIAEAVLEALAAAHAKGLVHRDVKPGNILLPAAGGVKLSDFGIAKSLLDAEAGLTVTGQLLGTPQYLTPEQVDGRPASPRSDLYAVGVLLYEMLSGRPPFSADTPLATAMAHRRSPPPPLEEAIPGLSPGLAAVVHRALEKDPASRYADAGEMRAALRGSRPTVPVGPVVRGATTARMTHREPPVDRRWLAPALVALLLVFSLVGFAATRTTGTGTPPAGTAPAPAHPEPEPAPVPEPVPEPEPVAEPAPEPGAPADLPSLIGFLAADSGGVGEKGDDLLDLLMKVVRSEGRKQREEATKAADEVGKWVSEGELDAVVGGWALHLLEPLRDPPGQRGGGRGDRDD